MGSEGKKKKKQGKKRIGEKKNGNGKGWGKFYGSWEVERTGVGEDRKCSDTNVTDNQICACNNI
jgi:hypothetical protein